MATTSKYQIQVGVTGADQAAQKLGGVSRGLGSLAKQAAAAGAAYFGANAILAGMKKSIELAKVQEQAEARLSAAFRGSTKALRNYASELQKVTTFGDEVTISAMARLAAYTRDEEQIKKLIKVTQDFATLQEMDLVNAAELVGKSFGSSTNALSRYGIEVTGAAGSMERFTSVLEALIKKAGGAAEAVAQTQAGKLEQISNAWGDMLEPIGAGLTDLLVNLAEVPSVLGRWADNPINILGDAMVIADAAGDHLIARLAGVTTSMKELDQQAIDTANEIKKMRAAADTFVGPPAPSQEDLLAFHVARLTFEEFRESLRDDIAFQMAEDRVASLTALIASMNEETNKVKPGPLAEIPLPPDELLSAWEEYEMATFLRLGQMEQEQEHIAEFIRLYPEAAEALGLVTDETKKQAEATALLAKKRDAIVSGTGALLGSFAQLNKVAGGNAALTKRLAQGEAIINTYSAANKALNNPPGPPWTIPAMLATVTMGLANVAQIEAQKFARGGDFVTSGPQMIMVGDNPGGRERVQITPTSSPNLEGPRGGGVTINLQAGIVEQGTVAELADRLAHRLRRNLA